MIEVLTQIIAGRELTLTVGRHYRATRPIEDPGPDSYPVSIKDITENEGDGPVITMIECGNYETANFFIKVFNCGARSFEGRVWPEEIQDREGSHEEPDFTAEDLAATDRAWASIAAQNQARRTKARLKRKMKSIKIKPDDTGNKGKAGGLGDDH